MPIEVRQVMSGPPGDAVTRAAMTKPWTRPPSICCANLRRRCSVRSLAVSATSPSAEDAVQEAMIAAFTQWPQEGIPENPRGWLIQVASRRMTDQMRSEIARRREGNRSRQRRPTIGARRRNRV